MVSSVPAAEERCTFHQNGMWCGRAQEDEAVHVWPTERRRPGAHVWRHDPKDASKMLPAPPLEDPEEALEAVQHWLETKRTSHWTPGYSEDFRRGYDAAIEEVEAVVNG